MQTLPNGKIFVGAAQTDLQATRPTYTFVPDYLLKEDGTLDREA